jgi:hypothetical protein
MTILEHFEKAKADGCEWADAAIRNTHPAMLEYQGAESLSRTLTSAFNFETSPEGSDYWINVFQGLFPSKLESGIASLTAILEHLKELKNAQ